MSLIKGDKVVIISGYDGDDSYHYFPTGSVVEFVKDSPFGLIFEGITDDGKETQFLLEEHFSKLTVEQAVEKVVDTTLPTKASYAVFNARNEIVATTADRDYARELKAALGGKRQGVRIFSYVADKEIR